MALGFTYGMGEWINKLLLLPLGSFELLTLTGRSRVLTETFYSL